MWSILNGSHDSYSSNFWPTFCVPWTQWICFWVLSLWNIVTSSVCLIVVLNTYHDKFWESLKLPFESNWTEFVKWSLMRFHAQQQETITGNCRRQRITLPNWCNMTLNCFCSSQRGGAFKPQKKLMFVGWIHSTSPHDPYDAEFHPTLWLISGCQDSHVIWRNPSTSVLPMFELILSGGPWN